VAVDPRAPAAATPPIGSPIANTQTYVLDRHFRPVPIGVPGELFIGGDSLARGYLGRPLLTAEKFISVRLSSSAQSAAASRQVRLYRTGDLVRWTPHGELDFLGRIDGQVKIRGCRIELGEIEATIRRHPAGRESVVLARPDERGHAQLVAYVLVQPDAPVVTDTEITEFLREKLPAYMVPAAVVLLNAWPLTQNGKIDRNALPAPELRSGESRAPFAAPHTPVEQAVARVWAEVLGRGTVGLADNFFDLGGHSLLAAQVVTRLNTALAGAVSVRALFDQPTLAAFAREVEARLETNPASRAPIHRVKRRTARTAEEVLQTN
jgi:hypothetical protein